MQEIYLLSVVIGLAIFLAIIVKRLKLPLLVSYIGAGAILSAFHLVKPEQLKFLAILPEMGLAFLLFLVGMELDLREFKNLGFKVLLATVGQVVMTVVIVACAGILFNLPLLSAIFIGLAVAFSSTILVVKLLFESKELSSIYGKLSIGILLVEDLLAVVVLMMVTALGGKNGGFSGAMMLFVVVKGLILMAVSVLAGKKILPRILTYGAENSELLFLTAIGWCLIFVSFAQFLGFSLAIGAFLAGVSLAQSVFRLQISSRIKPLRDFFIMIFFLDLGSGLSISGLSSMWMVAILMLGYVVVVKPIIFFLLFTAFKFRAHSAFQTGILLSSISEFSLILMTTGARQGILPVEFVSPFIFATVFSFVVSSLLISHGRVVYGRIKRALKTFEDTDTISLDSIALGNKEFTDHAILIGCHRSGEVIVPSLEKVFEKNLVILDFNPDVIVNLRTRGINCIYGDISDVEIQERLNLGKAKLVISTVRDLKDNLILLDGLSKLHSKAAVMVTAADAFEAEKLYHHGAHHVSLPLALEGANIAHLVREYGQDVEKLVAEKGRRMEELKKLW